MYHFLLSTILHDIDDDGDVISEIVMNAHIVKKSAWLKKQVVKY